MESRTLVTVCSDVKNDTPFAHLLGKPIQSRTSGTTITDVLLERYRQWMENAESIMDLDDLNGLKTSAQNQYALAQGLLRDIAVPQSLVQGFAAAMQEHEHSSGGIFLSAVMEQAGRGWYQLHGVNALHWLGYGLSGIVIETDVLGDHIGNYLPHAEFRDIPPHQLPKRGVTFVAQQFGHETGAYGREVKITGGRYSYGAAYFSKQVIVNNGTFGEDAMNMAGSVHIVNGTFEHFTGNGTGAIVIDNGVFGSYAASLATKAVINGGYFGKGIGDHAHHITFHGGDFANDPRQLDEDEKKKGTSECVKSVVGNVKQYTKDGETRWKVLPHT